MFARMTKPAILTVALAAALGTGVTSLVNCSSGGAPSGTNKGCPILIGTPTAETGNVGFSLTLPGGAQINSVTYTLLNRASMQETISGAVNPGMVNMSNSGSVGAQRGGVPAGTSNYLSIAASIAGGGTCQGSASGITVNVC